MVQIGALLQSTRRLLQELEGTALIELPVPPLPVRLHLDDDGRVAVDVLVTLAEQDAGTRERTVGSLLERGLRVTTLTDRMIAGWVRANDIDAFEGLDADVLIEAAHVVHPELDISVPEAHAGPQWGLRFFTGQGMVIGIVDSGVDITHPSLRSQTGRTRILRLWDQTLHGAASPPPGFGYGSEWDSADIDLYLSSSSASPFPSADRTGHGTAVAGIAAGNGEAAPKGRYVGVAGSADLVVVTLEARRGAFASSANVVNAVKYIFDFAEAIGRRAVVNLSHGAQLGPHDPRGQFEQFISDLLTLDERRILVKSAGNMGTAEAHTSATVPNGGSIDLVVDVPRRVGPSVVAEFWYDSADFLAAEVTDTTGVHNLLVDGNQRGIQQMGSDQCEISGTPVVLGVQANQIMVTLRTVSGRGDVTPGRWTVRLYGRHVASGEPVHAWLEQGWAASPRFAANAVSDCTVTGPGMADDVVVVGAYRLSPTPGAFFQASGRGPDRRGQALRGLAAPGDPITSCAASTVYATAHAVFCGTSFAAPHVTGAIALMLQAKPAFTRKQILDCLLRAARTDPDTALGPATGWGAGKLCILPAVICASRLVIRKRGNEVSFRIYIDATPGLAGTGNVDTSQGRPYDEAVGDFLATPGVAGTSIEDEFEDVQRSSAEETAEGVPGWEALRRFVTGRSHTVTGEDKRSVELGAYWLTLPEAPDAKVEFSISDAKSTDTSASLTVAGIGGGPQFTVGLKEGLKHEARCSEKGVVSTIATFQQISVTNRQGTVIGTYPRLVALDKNRLDWSFVPATPPRAADLGAKGRSRGYDQSRTDGSTIVSLSIERDITWSMSAGISLPNFGGVTANMSTKVTYRKAVEFQYQLPGRHRYEATRYDAFPAYIWSVQL